MIVPVHPVNVKVVSEPTHMVGLLAEAVKFNTTFGLTVIITSFDLGLWQVPDVQTAEYVVVTNGFKVTVVPILPSDHLTTPVQPVADSVTLSPAQISVLIDEITGPEPAVITLIANSFEASDLHVDDSQIAVYFTSAVGVTVLGEPVTPSDHFTVPLHPLAVNVTEFPAHISNVLAVIVGLAKSVMFIFLLFELSLTQVPIEQVAVYEVETNGFIITIAPFCPSDHVIIPLSQPVAVN